MDEHRKPPVGSRPGTLAINPEAPPPRIRVIEFSPGACSESEVTNLDDLGRIRGSASKFWIDVQGLGDEATLRRLADVFSIHPLALEDVVHVPIRPKIEPYPDNLLVVTRMPCTTGSHEVATEQVSLFLGENWVLTFQEAYGDVLDPVRKRVQVPNSMLRRSRADYLAYAVLDTIVDAYFPVVETLGDTLEELEERVMSQASPEVLRQLNRIKNTLIGLRRAVVPQREAINALLRGESELVGEQVRFYLRDTYDHIVQTSDAIEVARELVNGLMNTYLSVVSNRMNEVMKTLTIVGAIFIPLTFMAGIYGMNFDHMPELHFPWGYPALLVAMAVLAVLMVVYFGKKGWLGGGKGS